MGSLSAYLRILLIFLSFRVKNHQKLLELSVKSIIIVGSKIGRCVLPTVKFFYGITTEDKYEQIFRLIEKSGGG